MSKLLLDSSKILWHTDRVEKWVKGERIYPITIDMALTRACNYKCVYCYSQMQENKGYQITLEVMDRFLDDCVKMDVKAISLVSDGESTCNPIWTDVIVEGKKRGIDMAIGTNGYLVTRDKLEKVLPYLTYFRFNISAGKADRYSQIHGVPEDYFHSVKWNILDAVEIKKENKLPVTIGLQMVCMPEFIDDIIPLAKMAVLCEVDYLVIKHVSDDEEGTLGIDYSKYANMENIFREAESLSTEKTKIIVKWEKIRAGSQRTYTRCRACIFHLQISGSGLVAPCLHGDTRMVTERGLEKIKNIKNSAILVGNNFENSTVWESGIKKTIKLTLSNGQTIISTPNHEIYNAKEWVKAKDLLNQEIEPSLNNNEWQGINPHRKNQYLQLGFVFGDGYYEKFSNYRVVCIGEKDRDIEYLFKNETFLKSKTRKDKRFIRKKSKLNHIITQTLGELQKCEIKRIPERVFLLSPTAIKLFLKGLYSANGCVEKNNRRISYKTISLGLAQDIQIILLSLGIKCYININKSKKIKWNNGEYTSKENYSLIITEYDSICKFRTEIGFVQKYKQNILNSYKIKRNSGRKRKIKVIKIEDAGYNKVYDFSVESDSHSGWANGFIVHNCGPLFGEKYSKYHIGNFCEQSLKDIIDSDKYWEIMKELDSNKFDASKMCGCLCLQHHSNVILDNYKKGLCILENPFESEPRHANFI